MAPTQRNANGSFAFWRSTDTRGVASRTAAATASPTAMMESMSAGA
jgi:hypothetical protein